MPPPVEPEKAITMAEKRKRLYKSRMKNHTYKWRASMPISFQQVMYDNAQWYIDLIWIGFGLDRIGSDWIGLDLDWIGLDLDWIGLDRFHRLCRLAFGRL